MASECPIKNQLINQTVARLVALLVVIVIAAGYWAFLPWFASALAVDFFIRGFTTLSISPLTLLAKLIAKWLGLPPKMINAGPKIFAARLGFIFSTAIALLAFNCQVLAAEIVAGALGACAGMEAFFSFCVGCRVYSLFHRLD
ncbi:MAG: DUF4395 domain-containing protein [Desulfobulbaceae bacterium]|nr:DUF4395 domain-containing protein [Desulfobulbaceae bacterium]